MPHGSNMVVAQGSSELVSLHSEGGHSSPHIEGATLRSIGGSTFPQWQYWRSLICGRCCNFMWKNPSPKSCQHKAILSASLDTSSNAKVLRNVINISHQMVGWERVVVAAQHITWWEIPAQISLLENVRLTSKPIRALVVFVALGHVPIQLAIGGSNFPLLAV